VARNDLFAFILRVYFTSSPSAILFSLRKKFCQKLFFLFQRKQMKRREKNVENKNK
jgi:hypothetical protein